MLVEDLELFAAISEAGTLSAAARLARTTPSTVSRRMSALEKEIGVKLIIRTTRLIALTAEGELFLRRMAPMLNELNSIKSDLREAQEEPRGLLRISASLGFGSRYIAPLVGEFRRLYPAVWLDLRLEDVPADLGANEADVAIRVGRLADSSLQGVKLASLRRIACASPGYLNRRGRPAHPRVLCDHECIVVSAAGRSGGAWAFLKAGKINLQPQLLVSSHEAAAIAAIAGAGVAHLPLWMVATDVKCGRLERVLAFYEKNNSGAVHLLWRKNAPAKVRAFVDFLRKRVSADRIDIDP